MSNGIFYALLELSKIIDKKPLCSRWFSIALEASLRQRPVLLAVQNISIPEFSPLDPSISQFQDLRWTLLLEQFFEEPLILCCFHFVYPLS